jgi:virulence-associated protein VapD
MAVTYDSIASFTFSNSTTGSYTFSSISQSYTDLRLVITGTNATTSSSYSMRFNNNSSSVYISQYGYANSTSVYQAYSASQTSIDMYPTVFSSSSGGMNMHLIDIVNYSSSSLQKVGAIMANTRQTNQSYTGVTAFTMDSTTAISSITITTSANFGTGTTLSLYGILKA